MTWEGGGTYIPYQAEGIFSNTLHLLDQLLLPSQGPDKHIVVASQVLCGGMEHKVGAHGQSPDVSVEGTHPIGK